MSLKPGDVTRILEKASTGDRSEVDRLMPLVYEELRNLAERYLQRERVEHTLQPTALVHEAFLKLADQTRVEWKNRCHFFGVAATAMRRILVDHARGKLRNKRGGERRKLTLVEEFAPSGECDVDLVSLDDAVAALARLHERQARIVELRFFAGLTVPETAEVLGVSVPTIEVDWRMAKAWLRRELGPEAS